MKGAGMAGNSNSGRAAKTPMQHLADGNRSKKNPNDLLRDLEDSARIACAPQMPDWLSSAARAEWKIVVPSLLSLGWLHELDKVALASYCEAYADLQRFRRLIALKNAEQDESGDVQTFATGAKQISVWRQLANDAEKRANAAGAQFGMSPLARRNMKAAATAQGELFTNEAKDAVSHYFQ